MSRETSPRRQFASYSFHSILNQTAVLGTAALIAVITARVLGPAGRGELTLLLLIPFLFMTLGRMGLGHAVNYYAGKTPAATLIANGLVLATVLGVGLMLLAFPVTYLLKDVFFKSIDWTLIALVSLFIPFYAYHYLCISLFQGLYRIRLRNFVTLFYAVTQLLLLVVFTVALDHGLNGAVAASVLALFLTVLLSLVFFYRDIVAADVKVDPALMKQLLRFGSKAHIGNVLKDLNYRGDILVISFFLPASSVGYYAAAVTVAEAIWTIPDAVGGVLMPRVTRMAGGYEKSFTPLVSRVVLAAVCVICLVTFLLREPLVAVAFGSDFMPAVPALALLLPGVLCFSIWKILASDLIAQGHPMRYSVTSGIALGTMIGLDLWLVPRFGINGAAIASTIAYAAATLVIIYIYIRLTKNSVRSLIIPEKDDVMIYK